MFRSLYDRAQRTIRGSADDIGWLLRSSGEPQVEDGSDRFTKLLDDIRHGVHRLPKSIVYLLIPGFFIILCSGLFSNYGPLYFMDTKTRFLKMGLTCHIAKIHSEASVVTNAGVIKEYIKEIHWGSMKKRVLLLGHSKGGVDAAAALALYWPELKDIVMGLVLVQSPYAGSPIASDILREGQLGDYFNLRKMVELLVQKMVKGDIQALEDLTYDKRKDFLRKHRLPKELCVVSFHSVADISPAIMATLSHVAHADLPLSPSAANFSRLPVMMPLSAVMAVSAQMLQTRYRERSDGLVTCQDAIVPGSIVVRPRLKLDHAWLVYSSGNDPSHPDASQICEALLALILEARQKNIRLLAMKDD